jgi:hypothetical protein
MLRVEIGVPDLEGEVTRMRSIEIQLFERGIAGGAGEAERHRKRIPGVQQEPHRTRGVGEVASPQPALWVKARIFDAAAELEGDVRPHEFLENEGGGPTLIHRRRQRLRADGLERSCKAPATDGAFESTELSVTEQQLQLRGVVLESSADLRAFELLMFISAHANGRAE